MDYYNVLKTSLCKTSTFLSVYYKLVKERYDWSEFLLESEPGVCCRLDIVSVSNNLSSSPLNYFVKRSEAGLKHYLFQHLSIFFILHVLQYLHVSRTTNRQTNFIQAIFQLKIMVMCQKCHEQNLVVLMIFSYNDIVMFFPVPGPVDNLTAKVSRMAVKLYWAAPRHPNGIIDEYTLTFGTRNKEKHVKFNCIDCPSVTNCSFIKTRMLVSSI